MGATEAATTETARRSPTRRSAALTALVAWLLLGLRWFDPARALRPAWLSAAPPALLFALLVIAVVVWLAPRRSQSGPALSRQTLRQLVLVALLTVAFRLPALVQGAAGYLTPDGALSGLMALHLRDGGVHDVFVPQVPYSGSLKSHLAALLGLALDMPRAFALASILFYVAFAVGVTRLAQIASRRGWPALAAGLYVAFSPPFLTRYGLSNDGNYVEVLALGSWALVLACRLARSEHDARPRQAILAGLLLGLALWCHILTMIYIAALGVFILLAVPRAVRVLPLFGAGLAIGYWPGWLWNQAHGWESFLYMLGRQSVGVAGFGLSAPERAVKLVTEHLPTLVGLGSQPAALADVAATASAALIILIIAWSLVRAIGNAREPEALVERLLLLFVVINVVVAVGFLPYVPEIPRYVLFLMTPFPVLLALALDGPRRRWLMAALIAFGATGSIVQAPDAWERDAQRRSLAARLEALNIAFCYTDFSLAPIINFVSEERVVCTAKLGPLTTEYFFEYRTRVEAAQAAAFVPINRAAADKLERRLRRLGVTSRRDDAAKPIVYALSRKVDPEELFPDRSFPWR
jgi:hypothetical protein